MFGQGVAAQAVEEGVVDETQEELYELHEKDEGDAEI